MGFLDNVKKSIGSGKKKDLESQNAVNDELTDTPTPAGKIRNFKYLDELIHSGAKEIVLDSDIRLSTFESIKYIKGIKIDVDNLIIDGKGHSIDAKNKTRIFNITSNATIKNITLKNGYAIDGGAISIERGNVIIDNCKFQKNTAITIGGAIDNLDKLTITKTLFNGNTNQNYGGAINNHPEGDVKITGCQFQKNSSKIDGGAINNWGKLSIKQTPFNENSTQECGGAIKNQPKGNVEISNCSFQKNSSKIDGGAIINFGKLSIKQTPFNENSTQECGGAIENQPEGNVEISDCSFQENTSESGGAINNWGKLSAHETSFNENTAKDGGSVIKNHFGSLLRVADCNFLSNNGENATCIYNDSEDVRIINSIFSHHAHSDSIIHNKRNMDILGCSFKSNEELDCIIYSEQESRLIVSGGRITDNRVKKSAIHTAAAECSVSNTSFRNNVITSSDSQRGADIFNETKLSIHSPKIANDDAILNKGHVDVKKLSHDEAERIIYNLDDASIGEFNPPSEYKSDFSHLNSLIANSDGNIITLKEDITLENYELDFYEGGINLDRDNLTIDGANHFIDGKRKTRMFHITGKNITLKNIIFKNGLFMAPYDENISGGGAIRTVIDSALTLENCKFIDNASQNNGGAILNNGMLKSKNNRFLNNSSECDGGAIQNNGILHTAGDALENNASKIAGAIYNNHELTIKEDMTLKNNLSDLKEDIYNAGHVKTENMTLDTEKTIFNTCSVNADENAAPWQTLQYLMRKLKESPNPVLDENVKIKFNDIDNDLILMDNVELDGNNHILDFSRANINFKIKNRVTIKNLTFKNALVGKDSLFEIDGNLELENVTFLNNKINTGCYLLNNYGDVKLNDSHFYNNRSKNNSLISNNSNLEIANTSFVNNRSDCEGSVIYNIQANEGKVSIENSLFKYNSSNKSGGTIFNGMYSVFEISNSEFIKNASKIDAGAIYNEGKLKIAQTLFQGNSARIGGAITTHRRGKVKIDNCKFQKNAAKEECGAILNWGELTITETLFNENSTQGSGGAIYKQDGDAKIANCKFQKNNADKNGGAIINWGELTITETLFNENSAQRNGGAINNQPDSKAKITNCKFQKNNADMKGGAIWSHSKRNLKLKKCTFKDNQPEDAN